MSMFSCQIEKKTSFRLVCIARCDMKRRLLSGSEISTDKITLQPLAIGAAVEVTKKLKALVQRVIKVTRRARTVEWVGSVDHHSRNAHETPGDRVHRPCR